MTIYKQLKANVTFKEKLGLYNLYYSLLYFVLISMQGSHTPFWDWGLGPLELGKIAAFCSELGKNNKTYFVIHILVSFNMFKCTCIFIHTVLLEINVRFHTLFFSNLSFFLHYISIFLKKSNWENWGSKLGKKILFCIGNGAEYRPQIRQIESPAMLPGISFCVLFMFCRILGTYF